MSMKTLSIVPAILLFCACPLARAENPTRSEKDVAREIARRGSEYFDDGEWERAREHFHRAYRIVRAPTLALMEARSLAHLGRLLEAIDVYTRAAEVPFDDGNEIYRRAVAHAREELAALRERVPSIRVMIPAEGPEPEVRIDGSLVSSASPTVVDPGTHVVAISRRGLPVKWDSVTVREGEERIVRLDPLPPAAHESPAVARSGPSSALQPVMWTAFGVGGVGVVVGIVSGALALERKSDLDRVCSDDACPPGAQSDLRAYRNLRTASTVGYVVGVAGLGTGAVMLATMPRESKTSTRVGGFVSPSYSGVALAGAF